MHRGISVLLSLRALALVVAASAAPAQAVPGDDAPQGPRFLLASTPTPVPLDLSRSAVLRQRLSLSLTGVSVKDALKAISAQAGLRFVYSDDILPRTARVNLRADEITVAAALTDVLLDAGLDLVFLRDNQAALVKRAQLAAPPQVGSVRGTVTDSSGHFPIVNVQVVLQGTRLGAATAANGSYRIPNVPPGTYTLTARRIGFQEYSHAVTVEADRDAVLDVTLAVSAGILDQMVITGTNAPTAVRNLPFTVAHLDTTDMPVPGADPLTQLQGKVPGVNIEITSGRPGAQPSVLLRGPQSLNASGRSQEPLYIVDGVEMPSGLADIDPLDIESIEVVKGAAAASLYGSRAGSGVIQVTTKSGKHAPEGTHFTSRVEYGQSDIEGQYGYSRANFLTMNETRTGFCLASTNCTVGLNLALETLRSNSVPGPNTAAPVLVDGDGGINRSIPVVQLRGNFDANVWPVSYDPVAAAVTNGQSVNATVDATGRVGKMNYFASGNEFSEEGSIRFQPGYDRKSLRLNLDQQISDEWTLGFRTYYSTSNSNGAGQENAGPGFVRLTRQPAYTNLLATDALGRLFVRSNVLSAGGTYENPLYDFQATLDQANASQFLTSVTTDFWPLSWIDVAGDLNYTRNNQGSLYRQDVGFRTLGASTKNNGFLQTGSVGNSSVNGEGHATAEHVFFRDLDARLRVGSLYESQAGNNFSGSGTGLVAPGLTTLNAISDPTTISISSSQSAIRSVAFNTGADLTYKDRYIFSGLVRREGSSLFGSDERWATYGRAALAWRVSDESWWRVPGLSDLKLRSSIGSAGGRPTFSAQYETFSIGANGSLNATTLGNKNLVPEYNVEIESGIDGKLLNRFDFTIDYARSVNRDQILPVPPSVSSGFQSQWQNAGTMENKTWEATLKIPVVNRRDFDWSMQVNYDRNRAVITQLGVPPFFGGTGLAAATSFFRYAAGERYGTMYGRAFVTSCSQLPAPFRGQCGGAGEAFQKNSDGLIVWVGQGHSLGDGITNNLWQSVLPGCSAAGTTAAPGAVICQSQGGVVTAPWGVATSWGMPMILRDSTGTGQQVALGNALPSYRLSMGQNIRFRRMTIYGLFDGNFGRKMFDYARAYALGDLLSQDVDQLGKSVQDGKPLGYYWRAGPPDNSAGVGGLYDNLGPNNWNVQDASYVKLREADVSYHVGPVLTRGDWTVSVIGRNLLTISPYKGFDPEVGYAGGQSGSALINAVDYGTFPPLRQFTVAVSTRF